MPDRRLIDGAEIRRLIADFDSARNSGNIQAATALLSIEFSFESPLMRFSDAHSYPVSNCNFQRLISGRRMISELYAEEEAVWIYDLQTITPVGTQRTAEHFRVKDGFIASILLLFDATLWRPMMAAMTIRVDSARAG